MSASADRKPHRANEPRQPEAGERLPGARNPDDNMKIPHHEGSAPRPATEPEGSEGSARNRSTLTDPATGQPNKD